MNGTECITGNIPNYHFCGDSVDYYLIMLILSGIVLFIMFICMMILLLRTKISLCCFSFSSVFFIFFIFILIGITILYAQCGYESTISYDIIYNRQNIPVISNGSCMELFQEISTDKLVYTFSTKYFVSNTYSYYWLNYEYPLGYDLDLIKIDFNKYTEIYENKQMTFYCPESIYLIFDNNQHYTISLALLITYSVFSSLIIISITIAALKCSNK